MGKHKNISQDKILVRFMEAHLDFARGYVKGDRVVVDEMWSDLATQLNGAGPPKKDVTAWKKVWNDWKMQIRKKLAANKAENMATGGGAFNQQPLTPTEETVARISGIFPIVNGIGSSRPFGTNESVNENIPAPSAVRNEVNILSYEVLCTADESIMENTVAYETLVTSDEELAEEVIPTTIPSTPRRKCTETGMQGFMSSEIRHLQKISKEISEIPKASKRTHELLEKLVRSTESVNEYVKRQCRATEELAKFSEKRNEEVKRHNLAKEKHNANMLREKIEKNKLKLKEIELRELKLNLRKSK